MSDWLNGWMSDATVKGLGWAVDIYAAGEEILCFYGNWRFITKVRNASFLFFKWIYASIFNLRPWLVKKWAVSWWSKSLNISVSSGVPSLAVYTTLVFNLAVTSRALKKTSKAGADMCFNTCQFKVRVISWINSSIDIKLIFLYSDYGGWGRQRNTIPETKQSRLRTCPTAFRRLAVRKSYGTCK